MTISERIYKRMHEMHMPQKAFSEKTGIAQSTVSEWRSKGTNPTSEKIMVICQVLNVTPEWLLSGAENVGNRSNDLPWYVVARDSELGEMISDYHRMSEKQRARLKGYMKAMRELGQEKPEEQ